MGCLKAMMGYFITNNFTEYGLHFMLWVMVYSERVASLMEKMVYQRKGWELRGQPSFG